MIKFIFTRPGGMKCQRFMPFVIYKFPVVISCADSASYSTLESMNIILVVIK